MASAKIGPIRGLREGTRRKAARFPRQAACAFDYPHARMWIRGRFVQRGAASPLNQDRRRPDRFARQSPARRAGRTLRGARPEKSWLGIWQTPVRANSGLAERRANAEAASAGWSQTAPYGTPEGRSGASAGRAISATWDFSGRGRRGGRKGGPARATGRGLRPTCGRPLAGPPPAGSAPTPTESAPIVRQAQPQPHTCSA